MSRATLPRRYLLVTSHRSNVVHWINPVTSRSYCQIENNIEGMMHGCNLKGFECSKFDVRSKHWLPDCKNCVSLAAKAGRTGMVLVDIQDLVRPPIG